MVADETEGGASAIRRRRRRITGGGLVTKAGDAPEFTEVELMHLSVPNELRQRGEQLSTVKLNAKKQQ